MVLLAAVVPYVVTLGALSSLVMLFALVILGTTWNLLAGYGGMVASVSRPTSAWAGTR